MEIKDLDKEYKDLDNNFKFGQEIIKLTKDQKKLYDILTVGVTSHKLFGQYALEFPLEDDPYMLDFAYPSLKIGIEVSNRMSVESISGWWTIIRINKRIMNDQPEIVEKFIKNKMKELK